MKDMSCKNKIEFYFWAILNGLFFFSSLSLYESGKNKSVKRHLICYLQKNRYTYIQYMTSQLFQMFLLVPSLHHKLIYLKVTKNRVLRQMPTVNFVVFFSIRKMCGFPTA